MIFALYVPVSRIVRRAIRCPVCDSAPTGSGSQRNVPSWRITDDAQRREERRPMSQTDPMTDSRRHGARPGSIRGPLIQGDASRIESCVAAAAREPGRSIALTPEEIDEQIRQFFASDQL